MAKHFKLTSETKVIAGKNLFRIEATVDFNVVKKGDKGGWVEKESNISGNAWVSGNARVYGDAEVSGDARVYGNAEVYGDARVSGNAWVYGDARVYGNAWVSGNAEVYGNAWVYGDAWKKSPLQIQGSKHFFNVCSKLEIKIGCLVKTFQQWLDQFRMVGEDKGYTESDIEEYRMYIELAVKLYKPELLESKEAVEESN